MSDTTISIQVMSLPLPAPVWLRRRDQYGRSTWERATLYEWRRDKQGRWIARVARTDAHPDTEGLWRPAQDVKPRDPSDDRYALSWLNGDA